MHVAITGTGSAQAERFALLTDLGTITVPEDYRHETWLASFSEKDSKKFFYLWNDNITDANFPNPTRILKPGDKLRVKVFKQIVSGTTTSDERVAFLKSQKAVFTGAQGVSLVFEQKRSELPKGYWHASFDEENRLWKDACGDHRVPFVYTRWDGSFEFRLGNFESDWDGVHLLLCFSEE